MTTIFHEILNMSMVASWLILAVILLRIFLRRVPRRIVCILWALVAVRLVCPFSFESRFSLIPSAQLIENVQQQEGMSSDSGNEAGNEAGDEAGGGQMDLAWQDQYLQMSVGMGNVYIEGSTESGENADISEPTVGEADIVAGEAGGSEGNVPKPEAGGQDSWTGENVSEDIQPEGAVFDRVLSGVWLFGIIFMLGYAVFSYAVLSSRTAASIRLEGNVYICDDIDTPFVLGVFSPKVYLPSFLKEEREYVIAHEKAHLGRLDHFWKPLGYLILAVHWFNPLVWTAYVLLCKDIELACDERVIKGADTEYRKSYAWTLLACSAKGRLVTVCPLAFGEVSVKERIRAVLGYKKPAFRVIVFSIIICIGAGLCFMTNPIENSTDSESGVQKGSVQDGNVQDGNVQNGDVQDGSVEDGTNMQEGSRETDSSVSAGETSDARETQESTQESASDMMSLDYGGWHAWLDALPEYEYVSSETALCMRNITTDETIELRYRSLTYSEETYDELKEGELDKWGITQAEGELEDYIDGDVGISVYRYREESEANAQPGEGYLIVYGSPRSDVVWYMLMPIGMPREEVDAFMESVHVERGQTTLSFYRPGSSLSCMEQLELAEDKPAFLGSAVLNEDDQIVIYEGKVKEAFDCYAEEAKKLAPELYEALKNPVSAVSALYDLQYEDYEIYHFSSLDEMLVMFKLGDGQELAVPVEKRGEVWKPSYQYAADSLVCTNVLQQNEYIDEASAEQLKNVSNEVEYSERKWMELENDYVVLDSVENRDVVLYGLYGGGVMVLRNGDKILPIWLNWSSPQMNLPKIYCGDYDNDGSEEYALWTHMFTGTGLSGDELYMIETDWQEGEDGKTEYSIREYGYWEWGEELKVVGNRFDEDSGILTMTLYDKDVAELDISRLLEESGRKFKYLGSGSYFSFEEREGQWYFSESRGIILDGSVMESSWVYKVIVNARVAYDEENSFHFEDIQIFTEIEDK